MKPNLDSYLRQIGSIFRANDFRKAHELAKEHLLAMAKDEDILFEIIRRNISVPGFFSKKRINPVIAFDIIVSKDFSMIAHCWLPLPDRSTNTSHQSVHHHGRLLLTSAAPFGEGYESVIFKKGYKLDKQAGIANMEIEKQYRNPQYNVEFINDNTPHIVFYPKDFSITYAMWSYDKKDGTLATLRRSKFMQANKKIIIKTLRKLGLAKKVGINVLEYFDFYPENKQLHAMKERVMYPAGTNENLVHNVFYILQKVGFPDKELVRELAKKMTAEELAVAEKPMNMFLNDQPINDIFDPVQLNIPKINFSKDQLLSCFS